MLTVNHMTQHLEIVSDQFERNYFMSVEIMVSMLCCASYKNDKSLRIYWDSPLSFIQVCFVV